MTHPALPSLERFAAASDATWRGAETEALGAWRMRFSPAAAGNRASSVWPAGDPGLPMADAVAAVEAAYRARGLPPRFQLWDGGGALDTALEAAGYRKYDRSVVMGRGLAGAWPDPPKETIAIAVTTPLALMDEIWEQDGIPAPRRAVMERAEGPIMRFLGRIGMRPAGAVAAIVDRDVAVVHALTVLPAHRRKGVATRLMRAAVAFAEGAGAGVMAHSVSADSAGAIALYEGLGFQAFGEYHYRVLEEAH